MRTRLETLELASYLVDILRVPRGGFLLAQEAGLVVGNSVLGEDFNNGLREILCGRFTEQDRSTILSVYNRLQAAGRIKT